MDKLYFRSSSEGSLRTNPRGKQPAQKYAEAVEKITLYKEQYRGMNPETATAKKKLFSIHKLQETIESLAELKDVPVFSKTCKSAMRKAFIEHQWNRRKSIDNKFTRKGTKVEEQGITIYGEVKNVFFQKNKTRLFNDEYLITGELDLFIPIDIDNENPYRNAKETIDVKCSWDIWSFYDAIDEDLKKVYADQGQCYMILTETAERHTVAYVLVSTPFDQVQQEVKRIMFNEYDGDLPAWAVVETVSNMVYEKSTLDAYLAGLDIDPKNTKEALAMYEAFVEMPLNERVFEFVFERDESEFAAIKKRNHECKKYIDEMLMTGKWKTAKRVVEEVEFEESEE